MPAYFEPARTYNVELFCKSDPAIDKRRLLAELRRHCPGIEPLDGKETGDSLAFVHTGHMVVYSDIKAPAQVLIAVVDKGPDIDKLKSAIQQSWKLEKAVDLLASCTHTILITDLMASGLEYQTRFDLFQRVLRGVLATVSCAAIHWVPAEQVVACAAYAKAQEGSLVELLAGGPINVRLFNVEDSDEDTLMDTRGLSAFGLPDLQCHFRGLEPQDVAHVLYNIAFYVYQNGDVIEDGHTVGGVGPATKWRCQHEDSLAGPDRVVLDLNPGPPYAAGNR